MIELTANKSNRERNRSYVFAEDCSCNGQFTVREQLSFYHRLGDSNHQEKFDSAVYASLLKKNNRLLKTIHREKQYDSSWNYASENTKGLSHGFHAYPAMMIPQVAGRLLDLYAPQDTVVLDPFCGSGSVPVESFIRGFESYGIDINPLARLLSKVKTTPIDYRLLQKTLEGILRKVGKADTTRTAIPDFYNIDFWFKPSVSRRLALLKKEVFCIKEKDIQDFFKIVFSHTVRFCSNTRNGEFKLYRLPEEKLAEWNPDVFEIFRKKAEENIIGMADFSLKCKNSKACATVLDEDTRIKTSLADEAIDIVVTSPPYGDSKTTVAYGQFSRLSLQWLDFEGYDLETDKRSLGGVLNRELLKHSFRSPYLLAAIHSIADADKKRAREVLAFYLDLGLCLKEIRRVVKRKGYLCMVVGNRTVKGLKIPTDEIVADFAEDMGFRHEKTIIRNIPNKRMPSKNSPTNERGILSPTMTEEYIVVMRKG